MNHLTFKKTSLHQSDTNPGMIETKNHILELLKIPETPAEQQLSIWHHLEQVIAQKSQEIGYHYTLNDYIHRLAIPKEIFHQEQAKLLNQNKEIVSLIQQLVSEIGDNRLQMSIKKRILDEVLQDLVYESFENTDGSLGLMYCSVRTLRNEEDLMDQHAMHFFFKGHDTTLDARDFELFKKYGNKIKSLELQEGFLSSLDEPSLKSIFSHFQKIKMLHFSDALQDLQVAQVPLIFDALQDLRFLILNHCPLHEINPTILHQLSERPLEQIDAITQHFHHLHTLEISENSLNLIQKQSLISIFEPLKNLKVLHLNNNGLSSLDAQRLTIIFERLPYLQSIDLRGNKLYGMSIDQLHAIFDHIPQIEQVALNNSQIFIQKLIRDFPHLKNKISVRE